MKIWKDLIVYNRWLSLKVKEFCYVFSLFSDRMPSMNNNKLNAQKNTEFKSYYDCQYHKYKLDEAFFFWKDRRGVKFQSMVWC